MNTDINYASMTSSQWTNLFKNIGVTELQNLLMNKKAIEALINEDVSHSYPSINSLLDAARERKITDSKYYQLFLTGYVADLLDKRLSRTNSYGNWDYEEKKFELLVNLPSSVKWILSTDKYINILSKVDSRTVRSVGLQVDVSTKIKIFDSLKEKQEKMRQQLENKEIEASILDTNIDRAKAEGDLKKYQNFQEQANNLKLEIEKGTMEFERLDRNISEIQILVDKINFSPKEETSKGVLNENVQLPKIEEMKPAEKVEFQPKEFEYNQTLISQAASALIEVTRLSSLKNLTKEEYIKMAPKMAKEISSLSDEVILLLAQNIDRQKFEYARKNRYEADTYSTPPYKRDPYPLFAAYLDNLIVKEAENIMHQEEDPLAGLIPVKEKKVTENNMNRLTIEATNMLIRISNSTCVQNYPIEKYLYMQYEINGEILDLSPEVILAITENMDRQKLENERIISYNAMNYDKPPYKRDHYPYLFNYLDSQVLRDANNILKEADSEEAALQDIQREEEVKFSKETQDLIAEAEMLLQKYENVTYEKPNSLDSYVQAEKAINENSELSNEQKQELRNQLWADFDDYVEQNKGKHI